MPCIFIVCDLIQAVTWAGEHGARCRGRLSTGSTAFVHNLTAHAYHNVVRPQRGQYLLVGRTTVVGRASVGNCRRKLDAPTL